MLNNGTDKISYFRRKWDADLHGLDGLKTDFKKYKHFLLKRRIN